MPLPAPSGPSVPIQVSLNSSTSFFSGTSQVPVTYCINQLQRVSSVSASELFIHSPSGNIQRFLTLFHIKPCKNPSFTCQKKSLSYCQLLCRGNHVLQVILCSQNPKYCCSFTSCTIWAQKLEIHPRTRTQNPTMVSVSIPYLPHSVKRV